MRKWHKINKNALRIQFIRHSVLDTRFGSAISSLGKSIKETGEWLKKAEEEGRDEDWFDWAIDDTSELTEVMVGSAFVICQKYITSLVDRVIRVCENIELEGASTPLCGLKKWEKKELLLGLGPKVSEESFWSKAEFMNAVANYFKHCEEWPRDWDDIFADRNGSKVRMRTAQILRGIEQEVDEGKIFEEWSGGIMRRSAKVLGNEEYNKMSIFEDSLKKWGEAVSELVSNQIEGTENPR